jgi:hypothetical protein
MAIAQDAEFETHKDAAKAASFLFRSVLQTIISRRALAPGSKLASRRALALGYYV